MRIGFDAKWFHAGHPSGRVFTRNILQRLIRNYQETEFVLFMNSDDKHKATPFDSPNVEYAFSSLPTNLLSNIARVPFSAKNKRIDVLVTQNFSAPVRTIPQVTIVFDIIFMTDPGFFTTKERAYFSCIKPLLRYADDVTSISQYAIGEMRSFGFIHELQSSHVLPLGVDEHFFPQRKDQTADEVERFRKKYGLPKRFILYVGRLNQRKNLDSLLRSMLLLKDKSTPLVVCGSRDWRMFDFDELVAELDLGDRVLQLGHLSDEELPILYRSATAFAYIPFKEGFGLPPLEAMASGVPVVVSSTSSLPEVCGNAACYVNPEDVQSITHGLDTVLSSTQLQNEMIEKGFSRAKLFSWDRTAQRFMEIVHEVAAKSS